MNRSDGLEQELAAWLADIAAPRIPDYTTELVQRTARSRQRPAWMFPERWLPMSVELVRPVPFRPLPWRHIVLLAVVVALAIIAMSVAAGSGPRVVEPFGLASNGLVAYASSGDIYVVDAGTGERRAIAAGPDVDRDPLWSLDGTRLAFLRAASGGDQLVIVDVEGDGPRVTSSGVLVAPDSDSVEWSPDGRSIAVVAGPEGRRAIILVDTQDGSLTTVPVDDGSLEALWRPPDGRELLFVGFTPASAGSPDRALGVYLATVEAGQVGEIREVPLSAGSRERLRPMGWTPDGTRFALHRPSATGSPRTYIVDPETGAETMLDVAFGHVSNDGRRVAGLTVSGRAAVCVVDIAGGPCERIGTIHDVPNGTDAESLSWSPDDAWIVIRSGGSDRTILLDPDGGEATNPAWIEQGAESWQRRAP